MKNQKQNGYVCIIIHIMFFIASTKNRCRHRSFFFFSCQPPCMYNRCWSRRGGVENSDGGEPKSRTQILVFQAKVWARRIYNITLGDVAAGELIKGSQEYIDPIACVYVICAYLRIGREG